MRTMDINHDEYLAKYLVGENLEGFTVVEQFPLHHGSNGITIKIDAKIMAQMDNIARK